MYWFKKEEKLALDSAIRAAGKLATELIVDRAPGSRFVRWWEHAGFDEESSMFDSLGQVDAQHVDRCSPNRSLAAKDWTVPGEVLVPIVETRIKERLQYVDFGIVAGNVGSLVAVARQTGQSEIGRRRRPCVLLGANVVELERLDVELLRHAAVFTPSARSVRHALATGNCR